MAEFHWTAAQEQAIFARGCSIAVSAAAGSGKTAVLTRRIIERLLAPDGSGDLSRMLVVTFTKAAAAELVSRISDALTDELAKNPANAHLREQSMLLSSAEISTIDSFCLSLVRAHFQKLNLPADFAAGDPTETDLLMKQMANELISDYFEGAVAGERSIEHFDRFADTFGDVTREDALAETMVSLYQTLSSTVDFIGALDRFAARYHAAETSEDNLWMALLREKLARFLRHYRRIFEGALAYIGAQELYLKYTEAFAYERDTVESLLARLAQNDSYAAISEEMARYEPPRLPSLRGLAADPEMEFYKNARKEFSAELRKMRAELFGFGADELRESMRESAEMAEDAARFLRALSDRFEEEKRRRHIITFGDMERYALSLLQDERGEPSALALSLRDAYDEIYIDEYQDTNELQDRIFTLISRSDNRFTVGDIKQSIYSFRGSEPSIFASLLDARPIYEKDASARAVKIYLSENFRSSGEILDFCNGVFDTLFPVGALSYGAADRLVCGSGKHASTPELYLLSESDEEQETEASFTARKIAELLQSGKRADGTPVRPSDIAILLRSASGSAELYEKELKKYGIPCRNTAAASFFESQEVLLMLSLLNVIDNPSRDIYLAATLKSPLYGVTLAELLYLRRYAREHEAECAGDSLYDALTLFTEATHFAKGEKFLRDTERFRALSRELPCDRLIWQIYAETGIFSLLSDAETRQVYETEAAKANLLRFYHYARDFERGGFKGLPALIAFINALLAENSKIDVSQFAAPGDVVRILTIHKSKGLEFPICFLCETARRFSFEELKNKTLYSAETGLALKLSADGGLSRLDTLARMMTHEALRMRDINEELRVLYVALTRAKERLILTASVKNAETDYSLAPYGKIDLQSRYFSAEALEESGCFLDLILMGAVRSPEKLRIFFPKREAEAPSVQSDVRADDDGMPYAEAIRLISERLSFVYPYRAAAGIPSKLSVSKLSPAVLDEAETEGVADSETTEAAKPRAMPRFLMAEPDDEVTAAERGTATHTFMQFFDFESVARLGVEGEIRRLLEARFLFPVDAERIDRRKIERFLQSPLADAMRSAAHLYREKRFMIRYPASLFTERERETLVGETVLVQGIIDCVFFDSAGHLTLVDYKTDSFPRGTARATVEEALRVRHARQLGYYQLACRKLFGCFPTKTWLYSFALNDVVEILPQYPTDF